MTKAKDFFKKKLEQEFNLVNKQLLDLAELVVPEQNFNQFRKKLLNITNDSRRKIQNEVELNYSLEYQPSVIREDIVVVGNSSKKVDSVLKKKRRD